MSTVLRYHIEKSLRDGWDIRRDGASRARKLFKSKDGAIRYATAVLILGGKIQFIVHREDGTVQETLKGVD